MIHAPFAGLHARHCACRECAAPRARRVVKLQGLALIAAGVAFYSFALGSSSAIAASFGLGL
jgi:hypothetical protein